MVKALPGVEPPEHPTGLLEFAGEVALLAEPRNEEAHPIAVPRV
jgi:hypothetical protein